MSSSKQKVYVKEFSRQQHCPTCNRYVTFNEKLPDYVCIKCFDNTKDKSGHSIIFLTITSAGNGIQGKYVDSEKLYRSAFCYIKGVKCQASEGGPTGIYIKPFKRDRSKKGNSSTEILPKPNFFLF